MFFRPVLATVLTLPILSTCTHNLVDTSDVTYFDQLPPDAYDNDPLLGENKGSIYVRNDISYLDPKNGPHLTCLPNGQVKLDFTNDESAFKLNELATAQLLSHPVIIPHGYDSSSCPELADHTIFGPKENVPEESLVDLAEDGFAVMIAVSEDDVQEKEITFSVDWVTYHELIGVVGTPPKELSWLAQGVFPFSAKGSSSTTSARGRKRRFGGAFRSIGRLFANGAIQGATGWALDQIARGIGG